MNSHDGRSLPGVPAWIIKSCGAANKIWRLSVFGLFGLLCVRVLISAILSSREAWVLPCLFAVSGVGLGFWRPNAALFALSAFIPLLNGFVRIELSSMTPPLDIVFAGIYCGWAAKWSWTQRERVLSISSIYLVADVFMSLILLSIAFAAWKVTTIASAMTLLVTPQFGFDHAFFSITSGFALLSGIVFLRLVAITDAVKFFQGRGIAPILVVHALTLLVSVLFQMIGHYPEPYETHLEMGKRSLVPTFPGDDIHTLGSMAVVVFAFSLASILQSHGIKRYGWGLIAGVGFCLTVWSWSRAAWLALICIFPLVFWRCGLRRAVAAAVLVLVSTVVLLACVPASWKRVENPYAERAILLLDMRQWLKTNSDRTELYRRAVRIIAARPFTGLGAGSFYRNSLKFDEQARSSEPKFVHNALLQIAAEAGLPAMLSFIALLILIMLPLWTVANHSTAVQYEGAWLAAFAMLVTQLTANAINIFSSQMLLLCVLLAATQMNRGTCSTPAPVEG